MLRDKVSFILPFAVVAINALNSSGFVFLTSGDRLANYIACSTTFSMLVWASHWVIPSAFMFDENRLVEIRFFQFLVFCAGFVLFNTLFFGSISIAFTFLLAFELFFFNAALLIIYSKTFQFLLIEIFRGLFNLLNLVLCVIFFQGDPSFLVVGLTFGVILSGFISLGVGNKAPWTSIQPFRRIDIAVTLKFVLRSANLRSLLAARLLEILVIFGLTFTKSTETLIAVKLAAIIAQAVALNARIFALSVLIISATLLSGLFLSGVIIMDYYYPFFLPGALRSIGWFHISAALAFQAPFLMLLFFSLRK